MIKVLFVDDEAKILQGIKRMTRSMRGEWDIRLAAGGQEALELLEIEDIDVIVSDMKMPGMDGAELLRRVRVTHPQVVRIVLSGYAETKMVMKSVSEAHQYLAKPCSGDDLKLTIERALSLHGLLNDRGLRSTVARMQTIPSLPALYLELTEELESANPSTKRIGKIVQQDMGMTAKILQIINSTFFGTRHNTSDPGEAIEYLGLEITTSLIMAIGVFSKFENNMLDNGLITRLWNRSIAVGKMAKCIAMIENRDVANEAFTGGLLHDVGDVVMAVNSPKELSMAQELVRNGGLSKTESEIEIFGASHADIGAYLLNLWGLPRSIVEAVAFHHRPDDYQDTSFSALTAVHLADSFISNMEPCPNESSGENLPSRNYLKKLGLSERLDDWRKQCANCPPDEA